MAKIEDEPSSTQAIEDAVDHRIQRLATGKQHHRIEIALDDDMWLQALAGEG
jgi:hypothetical protein